VSATWVIIPTYNEAVNLERLVAAACAELDRVAAGDYRILVVDDGSPDGTGAIADSLAKRSDAVAVLHRNVKAGLGAAYLAGFDHALAAGAQRVIEMDADFSHDPRYLPALLAASADADVVLGSRYVAGGGVRDWSLIRKLISRAGGLYARAILDVKVHDLTGGFKCIRREVLEAIDLPSASPESPRCRPGSRSRRSGACPRSGARRRRRWHAPAPPHAIVCLRPNLSTMGCDAWAAAVPVIL